jgi:Xaa-Pro aminopeptidase
MVRTWQCEDCPLHGGTNHRLPVSQRARHRAEIQTFRDTQEATAKDLDNLADVFTGLVVTDDGPDVRGQRHSKLFSSRDDLQSSLPNVPRSFQPLSPPEAISSIQTFVNSAPKRTALPTRKERRTNTLADILGRIRTAQQSLDLVYELYATNSDHASARLSLHAAAETVVAAGKLLRSVKAAKSDKELAKMWDEVHAEALALDKLVDCVGAIVPKADVEMDEVVVEYNTGEPPLPTPLPIRDSCLFRAPL